MQCTEYSKRRQNLTFATLSLTFIIGHKTFPMFHADRVLLSGQLPCGSRSTFQNLEGVMWLANNGKGMLFSVKQAFVGRDEIRAPLKTSAWEARPKQRMTSCNQFSFGNVCWHSHWMFGTAGLWFSSWEQVDVEEDFSAGTTPIQAKSFDVKINVATCLEQNVADC